ncbi:protein-glutamate O-methyltransferase family protein [Pendulispora rubella]|uniref:Protein-glutamate O-methyltransferase family protein n=1 Tax=Pendulispora rubella TaxID=2741070 RepID=A0ABZ2L3B7_9BACT
MNESDQLAAPIQRQAGVGFADFTVIRRFPKIAATAVASLQGDPKVQCAIETLVAQIIAGERVDTSVMARPTPFWSRYLDGLAQATWAELPFFDIEFLFYHAMNSLAGHFDEGTDVFRIVRREAREVALEALARASFDMKAGIAQAVWLALLANEADYSQLVTGRGDASTWAERMVVDARPELLAALANPVRVTAPIHLIADNAGAELLADLVLCDTLLASSEKSHIVLHCKPWPMFVSDALPEDVDGSIDALRAHTSSDLRALGLRLHEARATNRLRVENHVAWGEPRHFDALDAGLVDALQTARVVIAKGDLNYRRFLGDRAWPAETPESMASRTVPFVAFALRVLKSETLVGVPSDVATRAAAANPDWRTNGSYALVQRLGHDHRAANDAITE